MKFDFDKLQTILENKLEKHYSERSNDPIHIEWNVSEDIERIADYLLKEACGIK